MPQSVSVNFPRKAAWALLLLCASVDLTACATRTPTKPDVASSPARCASGDAAAPQATISVLRSGRYTVIDLGADAPQLDLMQQIVDLTFPAPLNVTVGDALRYLLLRSGYHLCDSPALQPLESLPLPAAHLHLGPLTLRQAAQVLSGSAWTIQVDDITRRVCFTPPSLPVGSRDPSSSSSASVLPETHP